MNRENSRLEKLLEEQKQIENRIKQIQVKKNFQKRKLMAEKIINQIESRQSTNKRGKDSGLKSLSAIDSRYAFGAILLNILQIIFSITEPQTL